MGKDWTEIPRDIVVKIAEHIELCDDFEAFAKVCSSWRLASKEATHKYNGQLPLMTLVDPNDCPYRRLYNPTKRKLLKIDVPSSVLEPGKEDDQTRRYFSSRGWLIAVSRNTRKVALFNPFLSDDNNNDVIELPILSLPLFTITTDVSDEWEGVSDEWEDWMLVCDLRRFVLSSCPSKANNKYIVAVIIKNVAAFWRPGQDSWNKPRPKFESYIYEVCFFRGEFYGINDNGDLIAYGDLDDPNKHPPRVVASLGQLIGCVDRGNLYLMELKPECGFEDRTSHLLVIQRIVFVKEHEDGYQPCNYKTTSFKVWVVNVENGEVEQLRSLGNQAIFVGFNSTFSVKAYADIDDERGGCKANCIYYLDDNYECAIRGRKGFGRDMGIYSMTLDKPIHYRHPFYKGPSHLSRVNPPIWLEFPSV